MMTAMPSNLAQTSLLERATTGLSDKCGAIVIVGTFASR
jgi:hypothetical protein